jgi:replication factor C small subunit
MQESIIWTEKYRPQSFSEIKGQDAIVKRVEAFVAKNNMPHLLFAGPAGTGKSTLALVIAKVLFKDTWQENFLELNASDERGIDVVRIRVKDFARTRAIGDVPFKIIFLDECDALTKEAQQALRRTMENYTKTCRFILSCNYVSKLIDPIQSRCAVFKFKPLDKEHMLRIINSIVKRESISITDDAKEALAEICQGDCRRLVILLQSCASVTDNITHETIYSLASIAEPKEVGDILSLVKSGKFIEAKNKLLKLMLEQGLSGLDIIKQIQRQVWELDITPSKRLQMANYCGEIEFRMVEGSDAFIQLEALLAKFVLICEQ